MKQYKHRKSEVIVVAIIAIIFLYLPFFFNNNPTKTLLTNLFFIGMGLFGLYALMKSLETITLTSYSIVIKYPMLSGKEINLSDIYSLGDSNASQKLILRDYNGAKLAMISKSIVGIQELKEELKNIISRRVKIEPINYFVRANSFFISLFMLNVMTIGTITISISLNKNLLSLILLIPYLFLIYSIGKQPIFVNLNNYSINVKSLFTTRVVSMNDIDNVVQKTNPKSDRGIITFVVLELKQVKEISLSGFKPDDELLFHSCKYYFENRIRAT
jgi:hypothetical protein